MPRFTHQGLQDQSWLVSTTGPLHCTQWDILLSTFFTSFFGLIPNEQSAHFFLLVCSCVLHFTKIPNITTNKAHTLNQVILQFICVARWAADTLQPWYLWLWLVPGLRSCWITQWHAMYLKYLNWGTESATANVVHWILQTSSCTANPWPVLSKAPPLACICALIIFACLTDKMANLEPRRKENWRKGKLYKRWRGNIATFLLKSGGIETTIHEVPSVHDVCPLNSWQWK